MTFLRLHLICTAFALAVMGLSGPASAEGTVDVSPEEAERPFTFEDWCHGIKSYPAERCAKRQQEDIEAFEQMKDDLAEIRRESATRPPERGDIDFGTCDDDIAPVWGKEGCGPITEPGPSIQPVPRDIP